MSEVDSQAVRPPRPLSIASDRLLFSDPSTPAMIPAGLGRMQLLVAIILSGVAALGGFAAARVDTARGTTSDLASVTIESTPAGALVLIDGDPKGMTPLATRLPPRSYGVEVVFGNRRQLLTVDARTELASTHHVQFFEGEASPRPVGR